MKKLFSFMIVALISTTLVAQTTWKSDPMHSKLGFSTLHLGIADVTGLFKVFDVTVTSSKADFSDAAFTMTSEISSIDTEVEMRDNHLKSPDFFDAAKYPNMEFKSTSIVKRGKNKYKLNGNLTIHGVTKPVSMDLWFRGTTVHPQSKATIAGFQLTGTINRSEFNVGPNFPPPMISNEVKIKADGEFIKK